MSLITAFEDSPTQVTLTLQTGRNLDLRINDTTFHCTYSLELLEGEIPSAQLNIFHSSTQGISFAIGYKPWAEPDQIGWMDAATHDLIKVPCTFQDPHEILSALEQILTLKIQLSENFYDQD